MEKMKTTLGLIALVLILIGIFFPVVTDSLWFWVVTLGAAVLTTIPSYTEDEEDFYNK